MPCNDNYLMHGGGAHGDVGFMWGDTNRTDHVWRDNIVSWLQEKKPTARIKMCMVASCLVVATACACS